MNRRLLVILASVLLSGCNTVNMAYRNADWYLENRIDEYATFNAQQQEIIHQEVGKYIRLHREKLLPAYIEFLRDLNKTAQSDTPLTVADSRHIRTSFRELYRATMQPMVAPAARILASIDDKQILELEKYFAKENEERGKEMLGTSHEEYLEKRGKRTLSFLHWLVGSLSPEQEQKILAISRSLPTTGDIYLQQQEIYQHRLIAMLQKHASETSIAAFLNAWLFHPDAVLSVEQQKAMQASVHAWDNMIVQVHRLMTPQQKEHFNDLVTNYIQEMTEAKRAPLPAHAP
jgi:hypothetical protein